MQQSASENTVVFDPKREAWKRFRSDFLALIALIMLAILLATALLAPLIANPRPLLEYTPQTGFSMPFWRSFFAPESTEFFIEKLFNYTLLTLPVLLLIGLCCKKSLLRKILSISAAVLLMLPFIFTQAKLERVDYRNAPPSENSFRLMALLPYGAFEQVSKPYTQPCQAHPLGCDELGRDLATRIIYGSRISLAVGLLATSLAMLIGIIVGVSAGYIGKWFDIIVMRMVEILMCFPVFLLLLIIMAYFQEYKFEQSILAVIGVIAVTGWIGMAQLTRGEVLKLREMVYIKAARASGVPQFKIIFKHILPNIAGLVVITFSFGAAGAILSECGLSFLGFGVQPPTASWGNMLRAAMNAPPAAWHLMVFPGLMLFWIIAGFNLVGEGLRKAIDRKTVIKEKN